jgi:TfuA protein
MANGTVVFLGPSLPRSEAAALFPGARFLPPIKRHALRPFLDDPPPAIGVVDGEFYQSLAISPKEILPFLERKVPVFGSSSMGALRAVELEPYGMVGVGQIFAMFRSGRLMADDEVAMIYCPETLRPLSEPMVNLRVALRAARRSGLLSELEARRMARCLKSLYFPERTTARALLQADRILPPQRSAALRAWWPAGAPNAKAEDARELLRRMSAAVSRVGLH